MDKNRLWRVSIAMFPDRVVSSRKQSCRLNCRLPSHDLDIVTSCKQFLQILSSKFLFKRIIMNNPFASHIYNLYINPIMSMSHKISTEYAVRYVTGYPINYPKVSSKISQSIPHIIHPVYHEDILGYVPIFLAYIPSNLIAIQ